MMTWDIRTPEGRQAVEDDIAKCGRDDLAWLVEVIEDCFAHIEDLEAGARNGVQAAE